MTTATVEQAPMPLQERGSRAEQVPRLYLLDGLRLLCALAVAGTTSATRGDWTGCTRRPISCRTRPLC